MCSGVVNMFVCIENDRRANEVESSILNVSGSNIKDITIYFMYRIFKYYFCDEKL